MFGDEEVVAEESSGAASNSMVDLMSMCTVDKFEQYV